MVKRFFFFLLSEAVRRRLAAGSPHPHPTPPPGRAEAGARLSGWAWRWVVPGSRTVAAGRRVFYQGNLREILQVGNRATRRSGPAEPDCDLSAQGGAPPPHP